MIPVEMIPVGDVSLATTITGKGHPVLLIHGFPLNHRMWQSTWKSLSDSFRVIAPDLRGWGSSPLGTAKITMAKLADDLHQLVLACCGRQPVTWVGLSMGGYIAWEFVRRHPDQLARLILCDTRAAADDARTRRARRVMAQSVLRHGVDEMVATMVPRLFSATTIDEHPDRVALVRDMMATASPQSVARYLTAMADRQSAESLLARVSVPTLVVCGQHDSISTPDEMRGIADAIPAAQFASIPNAGHLPPIEQPDRFPAVLREFL